MPKSLNKFSWMRNLQFKFCLFTLVAGPSVCLLGRLNWAPDFICFISSQKAIKIVPKINPKNCPKSSHKVQKGTASLKIVQKEEEFSFGKSFEKHQQDVQKLFQKSSKKIIQNSVQNSVQKASKTLQKLFQKNCQKIVSKITSKITQKGLQWAYMLSKKQEVYLFVK